MRKTKLADARKLAASARIAYGAVTAPISRPARPGPATCAPERDTSSFEFPSTSSCRPTSDGRYDW
jgi:hypothetical protein